MKLSILIVSWNTRDLLEGCLRSIYNHPPQVSFEVLVVDNASTDGSPEMVARRFPQVRLIALKENLGFAGGNNRAYRASEGEYVLLLNPDTEVRPEALERLVGFHEANSEAGAAGARLLNHDGSLQYSCSPEPSVSREFARLFHLPGIRPDGYYPMDEWDQNRPHEVDVLLGACLMLRRRALEGLPGNFGVDRVLDEDYFVYSEEVDLCYRLRQSSWKLFWVPWAEVIHFGAQSTEQVPVEMFLNLYRGKVLYFRKHFSSAAVQLYKITLLIATLTRLALTPLALLERSQSRAHHLELSNKYRRLLFALPKM